MLFTKSEGIRDKFNIHQLPYSEMSLRSQSFHSMSFKARTSAQDTIYCLQFIFLTKHSTIVWLGRIYNLVNRFRFDYMGYHILNIFIKNLLSIVSILLTKASICLILSQIVVRESCRLKFVIYRIKFYKLNKKHEKPNAQSTSKIYILFFTIICLIEIKICLLVVCPLSHAIYKLHK